MIGATLYFSNGSKKSDKQHKRGKATIYIFLSSIYHPMEHDEKKRFNKEPERFYNAILRDDELLSG